MPAARYVIEFVGQPTSKKKGAGFVAGYLDKADVLGLCGDLGIAKPAFTTDPKAVKATLEAAGEDTDGADLDCAFFTSEKEAEAFVQRLDESELEPPAVVKAGITADFVYGVRTATVQKDGTLVIK